MKLTLKVTGKSNLLKKFKDFGDEGDKMLAKVTKFNAQEIEANAKRLAPVDFGTLRQRIRSGRIDDFNYRITSFAPYSAYMEFGTGRLTSVPDDFKEIAPLFRGQGIREVNIPPQPYMYPSLVRARKIYPEDLKQGLEILTKKFNG